MLIDVVTTAAPAGWTILRVDTWKPLEFVDLTDRLASLACGLGSGCLHVFTRHTTTGLLINEAEPLLLQDLADRLERWAPANGGYGHDDFSRRVVNLGPGERVNGHAHCRAALFRSSESVPVVGGALCLGRWQRVLLAEFDGPQTREVMVMLTSLRETGRLG
jgi:secondary thiamine-phosphate synthase enzyme